MADNPLTEEDILIECRVGLNMSPEPNEVIDRVIKQKLLAVKGFMKGSGVSDETLNSDSAIGTIVMGVIDLWDLNAGEIKFSPAFFMFVTQLASR